MEIITALKAFGALSQESRLKVFKRLVRCGNDGQPAGEIARDLGVPHNTLSTHLAILANAGLIRARREGRSIIYCVDFDGTRALLAYLLEDCCEGRPEICAPVLDSILPGCCSTTPPPRRTP